MKPFFSIENVAVLDTLIAIDLGNQSALVDQLGQHQGRPRSWVECD